MMWIQLNRWKTFKQHHLIDNLISSLTTIEGRYPSCGILLSGDFNRLNISRLQTQFKLKQLVRVPTRGNQTLDLILTNMPHVCNKDLVQTFPPLGLSDHLVGSLEPSQGAGTTLVVVVLSPAGILAPVVNANLAGISAPLTGLF